MAGSGREGRIVVALVAAACLASACVSLPGFRYLKDQSAIVDRDVRIVSDGRELGTTESETLLGQLVPGLDHSGPLMEHLALMERLAGTQLTAGNSVTLLEDGAAAYPAMLEAIRNARDNINLESFIFEGESVGQEFAEALLEKRKEGVQVNLIYDSFGSSSTPQSFFDRLAAAGVDILDFNPIGQGWPLHRDHRKLLVVDGETAFTGGINISDVYSSSLVSLGLERKLGRPWRDTEVMIEGPAVAQFQRVFLHTWLTKKGRGPTPCNYLPFVAAKGQALVQAIASGPTEGTSPAYLMYLSAVARAAHSIDITAAYFAPNETLVDALGRAVRRGVDVRLDLPGRSDLSSVLLAGQSNYAKLLKSGVSIYERRGPNLHAKTAVIDGLWSTIGSTNLERWSFVRDYELNAAILDAGFGERMEKMFHEDLRQSDEIMLHAWKSRPLADRLLCWMAGLFSYWF